MGKYRAAGVMAFIAAAFALASWLLPSHREYVALTAVVLAVSAATTALFSWPEGVAFVQRRSRLLMVVGWAVCIVGFTAGIGLSLLASFWFPAAMDVALYSGLALAFVGFMTAALPRMISRVEQSRADLAALKATERSPQTFNGFREGLDAPLSVVRAGYAFLQIAGPWAAVLAGTAYLMLSLAKTSVHSAGGAQLWLLGLLLLLIVAIYLIVPTVAVAWFRWTISAELPGRFIALPDRTVLSVAWRLWLALSLLGAADGLVTPKLVQLGTGILPEFSKTFGVWTGSVVDLLIIMVASSFALQLPAMAARDVEFRRTAALVAGRKMWPGLPVGLAFSLAAYPVLAWACAYAYGLAFPDSTVRSAPATLTPFDAFGLFGVLLVLFATIASAATYLSRAYLAAKARSGGVSP